MSTSNFVPTGKPCLHQYFRVGCLACREYDIRSMIRSATAEVEQRKETIAGYNAILRQMNLSDEDRATYASKRAQTNERYVAWADRITNLEAMLTTLERQVKEVCRGLQPDAWVQALESSAKLEEEALQQIWAGLSAEKEKFAKLLDVVKEDPSQPVSDGGLDLSKIPATADRWVSSGRSLDVFLRHCAGMENRPPTDAMGSKPGPAIMNYGDAISMFGIPAMLEENVSHDADDSPVEKSSAKNSGDPSNPTEGTSEDAEIRPKPTTEKTFRLANDQEPPTPALLSEQDQWALFSRRKYLGSVGILAQQYTKLVAQRGVAKIDSVQADSAAKDGAADDDAQENGAAEDDAPEDDAVEDEAQADDSTDDPATNNGNDGGWPSVEKLDWVGFTNWVYRCSQVDPKFNSFTLKGWNLRLQQRYTAVAHLENWEPPDDFDGFPSGCPDPREFADGHEDLIAAMEKLGIAPRRR